MHWLAITVFLLITQKAKRVDKILREEEEASQFTLLASQLHKLDMIRYCISTATPVTVKQQASGEWTAEGIGAKSYIELIRLTEAFCKPFNVTFYLTSTPTDCLDRLKNNLSDFSSLFMPIDTLSLDYHVPQPLFAGKLQFMTGYNVTDGEQEMKDTATVFTNTHLLKPSVYLWASILLMMLMTFVAVKVALFYRPLGRFARSSRMKLLKRQLSRMFYYNSERFKWITLLYSLLCFIMITSFLCLYKTSQVIVEKPFYAKNYNESLKHPSSLAFFYDQFAVVSTGFKNAPPDSIKGLLWAKLVSAGRQDDLTESSADATALPAIMNQVVDDLLVRHSIYIASSLIIPLLKSLMCGFTPEGQLRIIQLISDPSEQEVLFGRPVSSHSPWSQLISRKMRTLFETHSLSTGYTVMLDQYEMAADMVGASNGHKWRQKVVCDDENAFATEPPVRAIPLSYFIAFFKAVAVVWVLALILNMIQILSTENQH